MKKVFAFTIVLLLLFSMSIPAFADTDGGEFDNWNVVVGPSGYSYVGHGYADTTGEEVTYNEYLKPGVEVLVLEYDPQGKTYSMLVIDENFNTKGDGFFSVTESNLEKFFSGERKPVTKEHGEKQEKEIKCVVTPEVGVMLRQGPDTTYKAFRTIPFNTELTYRYVYKGEKYNWAYVTYKGQAGWCCIDYTEEIVATTETTTESTTESTAESTAPSAITTTAAPESEDAAAAVDTETSTTAAQDVTAESESFFGNTSSTIIICCLGAVVLALTAVVILLIVKRKKENG